MDSYFKKYGFIIVVKKRDYTIKPDRNKKVIIFNSFVTEKRVYNESDLKHGEQVLSSKE